MKKLTGALGLFLVAGTVLHAEPEIKGTAADLAGFINGVTRTVAVSGESEVRVSANRAVVSLSVITESKGLQDALRANSDVRSRVTAQLKQQSIPAERIQSSKFSSTPKFGVFGDKAKSYRVENIIRVAIQDEKDFRSVAGVVDAIAEVQYGGVEFEYEDREALKQKALTQACANANERSKIYEAQLGLKLSAIRFGEGVVQQAEDKPQPTVRKSDWGRSLSSEYGTSVQESASSFGELVFTAKVVVEYAVAR